MSKEAEAAIVAYQALVEGDVDAAASWLRDHAASDDAELGAWRLALGACLAMTAGGVTVPTMAALADVRPTGSSSDVLGHALEWHSLAAFVSFDREGIREADRLAELVYDDGDPRRQIARAERHLADGELEVTREILAPLRSTGEMATSAAGVRALCVDAVAACALGAIEDATLAARTASRRARILRQRAYRYLAGLCLAHARRRSGRPHLAVRILSALEPLIPDAYRGWLVLEQIATGQVRSEPVQAPANSVARQLATAAGTLVRAASSGDRRAFDEAAELLEARTFVAAESFRILPSLLDPMRRDVPVDARDFLAGGDTRIPRGLELLAAGLDVASWPVAVVRPTGEPPRRVVSAGLGLAREALELVPASRLRQGRTDVAAAVLALCPESMPEAAFFRATFGMRFVPPIHESVLAMTLSRVRKKLEGVADVIRGRGEVRLVPHRAFAVPDPRCAPPPEGAVLRLVAQQGRITARGAAKALGVSLRTVQSAVRQLVGDGELELDRAGRSIAYRVDDTSFTSPGA